MLSSISLWIAVIFLGRFLPYIGSEQQLLHRQRYRHQSYRSS